MSSTELIHQGLIRALPVEDLQVESLGEDFVIDGAILLSINTEGFSLRIYPQQVGISGYKWWRFNHACNKLRDTIPHSIIDHGIEFKDTDGTNLALWYSHYIFPTGREYTYLKSGFELMKVLGYRRLSDSFPILPDLSRVDKWELSLLSFYGIILHGGREVFEPIVVGENLLTFPDMRQHCDEKTIETMVESDNVWEDDSGVNLVLRGGASGASIVRLLRDIFDAGKKPLWKEYRDDREKYYVSIPGKLGSPLRYSLPHFVGKGVLTPWQH